MFDDRLKQLREEKGLNKKTTAKLLEIPYTTYIGYEKDEREPNSETLIQIANFFNCTIDFLLGRSFEKNMTKEQYEAHWEKEANEFLRNSIAPYADFEDYLQSLGYAVETKENSNKEIITTITKDGETVTIVGGLTNLKEETKDFIEFKIWQLAKEFQNKLTVPPQ